MNEYECHVTVTSPNQKFSLTMLEKSLGNEASNGATIFAGILGNDITLINEESPFPT